MFKKNQKPNPVERRRPGQPQQSVVFSYHANRSTYSGTQGRTSEDSRAAVAARHAKRLNLLKRGPVMAGLVVLGLLCVYNMLLGSNARVVPVGDAKGAIFLRSQETYTQAAQELLGQSFMNKTKLTANTKHLSEEFQRRFPELEGVTVGVPFLGRQPTVYIQPATPRLLLSTLDGDVFVVDSAGRALIAANQVNHLEKLGLPVVTDQSGLSVKAGGAVLPSTSVSFITEVAGQMRAKKLLITSLILPAGTSELDVRLKDLPYTVKYNLQGDARAEAGAYLAVKQQLEREHKLPQNYIDVRVADRAYYK